MIDERLGVPHHRTMAGDHQEAQRRRLRGGLGFGGWYWDLMLG
jgi:hypothetical protein